MHIIRKSGYSTYFEKYLFLLFLFSKDAKSDSKEINIMLQKIYILINTGLLNFIYIYIKKMFPQNY